MRKRKRTKKLNGAMQAVLCGLLAAIAVRADEPYARSRDYDLQHSRVALRFDLEEKKVIGDVTHSLTLLRDGLDRIWFDSVGLQIESVRINKNEAKFETNDSRLTVDLPKTCTKGQKFDVEIKYQGKPTKGLYFILPDKDYPNRPKQIWTQGESEDTRYYLPTYDYPNDRLTTETILTVPADWLTVSNGKLIRTADAGNGMKTWTWQESQPSSTYLFTVVAGEFAERKDRWRNIPVTYYAPRDRADRLVPNYGRTPAMIELFSRKLGVDYPWEKYAQSMVDDFVAGGMENSSATTNTAASLRHPKLVPEYPTDEDGLIAHELAHQWFGDLVTTKDWGNIWLNEGFATFLEWVWTEEQYGPDRADYDRWQTAREWFRMHSLYDQPIVHYDFSEADEFDANAYDKGAWVLYMLRHELGEEAIYKALKHYLEVNRGKNVVTADLTRAIEEATHTDFDQFFDQWVYGAGAPQFDVNYVWDAEKKQIVLTVKQTQKVGGRVGIFRVPIEVEITIATGSKLYPIVITRAEESFPLPSDTPPLLVLFDKGMQILKSVEFPKEKKELLYQLKFAHDLADRADAAVALAKRKGDAEVAAALGEALRGDKASGMRVVAAESLGDLGGTAAARQLLLALEETSLPEVRAAILQALGNFPDNTEVAANLIALAKEDPSYRARAAALQAIAKLKAPGALAALTAGVNADSPDGILRDAALRGLGTLGDEQAVPLLREWAMPGKEIPARQAAIASLARLQKDNQEITKQLVGYLNEAHFQIRMASVVALGSRGDRSAIPALEALLHSKDLSIEMTPMIQAQIDHLKNPDAKAAPHGLRGGESAAGGARGEEAQLGRMEQLMHEMNERLKTIEDRMPATKP